MKINGVAVDTTEVTDVVVIPRVDKEYIFTLKPINSFEEFVKLCPEPKPLHIVYAGETKAKPAVDEPGYVAARAAWVDLRWEWLHLQSLSATDGLEWDTVDMNDPKTWANWRTDLKNAGFHLNEIIMITNTMMRVNSLTDDHLVAARERFLASRQEAKHLLSLVGEPSSTPLGESVNDSESSLPE